MNGGSSLNILYVDAFDRLQIPRSALTPSDAPFHGVILIGVLCRSDRSHSHHVRRPKQLQDRETHLQGGGLRWVLQCHTWETMLSKVHGCPELCLPQAQGSEGPRASSSQWMATFRTHTKCKLLGGIVHTTWYHISTNDQPI